MLLLVGEGNQLCFYRGAVARPYALYLSVVERRVGQSASQRVVHLLVCIACPARQLLQHPVFSHEAELVEVVFALLYLHVLKVHRPHVYAHRRAGLHPCASYSVACYAFGQVFHGRLGYASAWQLLASYVQQSVQEGSRRYHHALGSQFNAPHGLHSRGLAVLYYELAGLVLPDVEVGRRVEHLAPFPYKLASVALCPRAPHGRAF